MLVDVEILINTSNKLLLKERYNYLEQDSKYIQRFCQRNYTYIRNFGKMSDIMRGCEDELRPVSTAIDITFKLEEIGEVCSKGKATHHMVAGSTVRV